MDQLNFVIQPPGRTPYILWCGAAIMVAAATWIASQSIELAERESTAERTMAILRADQNRKPPPKKSRTVLEQQKRWADLAIERSFPWSRLFASVEKSVSADVELHELIPDKVSRQLFLRGEARDRAALIEFIDALSAQPMLVNVHLTSQDRKQRDRLETVEFEIKARLLP